MKILIVNRGSLTERSNQGVRCPVGFGEFLLTSGCDFTKNAYNYQSTLFQTL